MTDEVDPQHLPVADLAKRCAQETELFFQHKAQDSKYCFELFRRAIRETDQFAWDMIYTQYKSLVTGWVKQNQAFEASGEEVEYFVNGAFGKMSGILRAERFDGFAGIGSLLSYLNIYRHDWQRSNWAYWGSDMNQAMISDFATAIRENRPARVTGVDGLRAVEATLAAYESDRTGQTVQLKYT